LPVRQRAEGRGQKVRKKVVREKRIYKLLSELDVMGGSKN